MHPVTECLALLWCLRQCSTGATLLCRVGGRDRHDLHASTFRLAVQDVEDLAPADIVGRLCQSAAGDALDGEGFMRDQAVLVGELTGRLVVKGAPLIGAVQGALCEHIYRLLASMAALLLTGHRALGASERLLRFAVVARR